MIRDIQYLIPNDSAKKGVVWARFTLEKVVPGTINQKGSAAEGENKTRITSDHLSEPGEQYQHPQG